MKDRKTNSNKNIDQDLIIQWQHWKQLRVVPTNVAILLSVDTNPELMPETLAHMMDLDLTDINRRTNVLQSWAGKLEWMETDAQENTFVDLARFAHWASATMNWHIPAELKKIATSSTNKDQKDQKNLREANNELRLIDALRTMLVESNEIYKSNKELIQDLITIHNSREPFSESTLENKFAKAKKISKS